MQTRSLSIRLRLGTHGCDMSMIWSYLAGGYYGKQQIIRFVCRWWLDRSAHRVGHEHGSNGSRSINGRDPLRAESVQDGLQKGCRSRSLFLLQTLERSFGTTLFNSWANNTATLRSKGDRPFVPCGQNGLFWDAIDTCAFGSSGDLKRILWSCHSVLPPSFRPTISSQTLHAFLWWTTCWYVSVSALSFRRQST